MKVITAKEYAEMLDYSPSAVTKKLKAQFDAGNKYQLPGAKSIEKFGNSYRISIPANFNLSTAKSTLHAY